MKVLKFGGTSVGSVASILSLKKIVEKASRREPVVVVVSALGGITDQLILTSQMALKGDDRYKTSFEEMVKRHHQMIDTIITDGRRREYLFHQVDALFDQLKSILFGVYLVHDLSRKTEDAIVSYGERLSSHVVATLIDGARRMNARDFIRTERKNGRNVLDAELTRKLVREVFGFSDKPSAGQTTLQLARQKTIQNGALRSLSFLDSSVVIKKPMRQPI